MLEQSVTESDESGGTSEGACQAPNGGIVPGTKWQNCTWHQMAEWCLAPNGGIVPGTKPRNGARYNPMIGHTPQSTKKPPGPLYKRSRGF